MSTPVITVAAVGVAISAAIAYLALAPDKTLFAPHVPGKNNTVLFLVNSNHGYSNVHLATAHAMMEKDPTVAIHFGTFDKMQDRVARINTVARARDPASHPVAFHLLPSIDYLDALNARDIMTLDNMITPPGLAGNKHFSGNFRWIFSPWTDEDHLAIYKRCAELIDEIDPSLVVLDPMFRPAMEAVQDLNRMYAVVSPNTLEVFIMEQKWGKMFWKYPSIASGFDYPLKWSQIPANIFAHARLAYNVLTVPGGAASRAFLRKNGIKNPLDFIHSHRIDRPWICQAQDPELTAWVKQKPTVLINLGSVFVYDEGRAKAMANAIANVLSQVDIQVIWKFKKLHTYGDDFKSPLQSFIDTGRVKLIDWLAVDPAALLETGDIMALVHHGGSNCYHEAMR
ncbi:unnamed protein product [Parascedosporium putredinis]|uniref:UDP-glucoronosyl and UDP-glucosyl transferase n=1 Tax=Parascedosporium putredinis TaxID=1442378 RepID=A0A9P1MB77_9PEZI|nr:unnamed protein product [Parascedosporium putredinis]CAI7994106.1 unnamed protein product [Parascedosporium putredinis]